MIPGSNPNGESSFGSNPNGESSFGASPGGADSGSPVTPRVASSRPIPTNQALNSRKRPTYDRLDATEPIPDDGMATRDPAVDHFYPPYGACAATSTPAKRLSQYVPAGNTADSPASHNVRAAAYCRSHSRFRCSSATASHLLPAATFGVTRNRSSKLFGARLQGCSASFFSPMKRRHSRRSLC